MDSEFFLHEIVRVENDPDLRGEQMLVYADWLEEAGRPYEAAGFRYLVRHQRWPRNRAWYAVDKGAALTDTFQLPYIARSFVGWHNFRHLHVALDWGAKACAAPALREIGENSLIRSLNRGAR